MLNFFGSLFGRSARSPKEAAEIAEAASVSIEERMERVKQALERGGYKRLDSDELRRLHEDLNKMLEFVEHAIEIIAKAPKLSGLDASLTRLRSVRTRVDNVLKKRVANLGAAA